MTVDKKIRRPRTAEDERDDVIDFINAHLNSIMVTGQPEWSLRTLRRKLDAGEHTRAKR